MKNDPFISVIMPAYNAEKYIQQSMESVMHQTYQHWELIIVDDGSIDNTAQIINEFTSCHSRIKYFYQSNGKQGKARNTGIKNAAGELIAFLDADDVWFPAKLKQQLHFMKESKADLVFNDIEVIDENGTTLNDSWGVTNAVYKGAEGLSSFFRSNKIILLANACGLSPFIRLNNVDLPAPLCPDNTQRSPCFMVQFILSKISLSP